MTWFSLALLCAFSLASADAATKAWLRDYAAGELVLVRFGVTGLVMWPLAGDLSALGDYPRAFWFWIAALVPLEMIAMLCYMKAIRDHPLALTLPYLAFTPVFVMLTGFLLLEERLGLGGGLGILLVVAGTWLLNRSRLPDSSSPAWRTWTEPFRAMLSESGARLMLVVALLYSLTAVLGKGAMEYMAPESFGAFYFALLGLIALLFFALPDPRRLVRLWRRPGAVLIVGLCNALMVFTHFLALQQIEVAYMIAVKRASLLFGMLYGAWLFDERDLGRHALAGGLMLGGIFFILY